MGQGRKGNDELKTNTLVCAFDPQSPRITAYDIHEMIYNKMCLQDNEVALVQIDGPRRHSYVIFRND